MIQLKLKTWIDDVTRAGCTVGDVKPLQEISKKNGEFLFGLYDADVRAPEGYKLPHIIFIRGHACLIVPLLRNRDTGEHKFLMVRQRRIGNGQISLEFPAGMLDEETDAVAVALKELEEETGLSISKEEMHVLNDGMLYSSAGASDEGIYYFCCIKDLSDTDFKSFKARLGGNPDENEFITVALMDRKDAEREATSLQARLGFYLFEDFCKQNGVPV